MVSVNESVYLVLPVDVCPVYSRRISGAGQGKSIVKLHENNLLPFISWEKMSLLLLLFWPQTGWAQNTEKLDATLQFGSYFGK